MPFHQKGNIRYYTFDCLDKAGITHAVFTRQGGVSPAPWDSLNLGSTVGDESARVYMNKQAVFSSINRDISTLFEVWQIHSSGVVYTDQPRDPKDPHLRADAILTDRPNITLLMRFADCVPIFLYDPIYKIAGIVHSGWPGTIQKIAKEAVGTFVRLFSSKPDTLLAAIGPSICVDHYEIGSEVEVQVRKAFPEYANVILPTLHGRIHFDLWTANQLILEESGVKHIELAGLCTACNPENWYSHRGENGKTGRFGGLICM